MTFKDIEGAARAMTSDDARLQLQLLTQSTHFPALVRMLIDHRDIYLEHFGGPRESTAGSHGKLAHLAGSIGCAKEILDALHQATNEALTPKPRVKK